MNKRLLLVILVAASAITMMSTDLYAPSLAHLPELLNTDPEWVKLTISLNVAAYSLATLIHGPLSDRFGRKPVLFCGLAGFTLASFLCGVAENIGALLAARALQGVTAAVEGVVVLAIIRDVFTGRAQVRALALYGIAIAFAPTFAPVLGGYIHVYFGWRMNFYLLTGLALFVTALVVVFLKESTAKDRAALTPREIFADYRGLLANRTFLTYIAIGGCGLGSIFVFITAGPFVLIKNHGVPTEHFGYYNGALALAYIAGSVLAMRFAKRRPPTAILRLGVCWAAFGALLLLAVWYTGWETPATLTAAIALIMFGEGPIFAAVPALAMDATDRRTGAAAALIITAEMAIGALASLVVSVIHDGTAGPMMATMIALTGLVAAGYLATRGSHGPGR